MIAFSQLLEEEELPEEARRNVPIPPPSTDDVVSRGIDELSAEIWDWAEQHPEVDDALARRISAMEPGGKDRSGSVAGMDVGGVSLSDDSPGEESGNEAAGANRPNVAEPGTSQVGADEYRRPDPGRRRTGGGRTGMTGDRPGSPRDAAASDLEDPEGLYVLRNAVNLARDLARNMRDRM